MAKNKKNAAAAAQIENVVVANEAVVENVVEAAETIQTEDKVAAAKAEAERLMAAAKEAAAAAKAAAKEAKEAAKKAKAFSSRPVRTCYFIAYYEDNEEAYIGKGDVHYCVEKSAIDEVARQREDDEEYRTVCIYKVRKDDENAERQLISKVYIDAETKQIVID